jgi:hypothetical protein
VNVICETSNLPGPFTSKDGREVLTNMKFHRKKYLSPLVHFSIRSTFDGDFKSFSTDCIVDGRVVKTTSHSISEETRIFDDFQKMGTEIQGTLAGLLKKKLQPD